MAITLRPYQAEAKEAILGEWAQGRKPLQKNNLQNRHEAEGAWGRSESPQKNLKDNYFLIERKN